MIKLETFKNIHKDKDIYVIGSGKSVDYIDNSFFDNKITIGINQVFKKLKTNYLVRKETQLIKKTMENISQDTIVFVSRGSCGSNNWTNRDYITKNLKHCKNIVLYNHTYNNQTLRLKTLPKEDLLIVSYSTITTGIHLAAYMGAKNIILVGHDCGTLDGQCNFSGYHTDKTYNIAWNNGKKGYIKWLPKIEQDTIHLKKLLKKEYNCNVHSLNPFVSFNLENHKFVY